LQKKLDDACDKNSKHSPEVLEALRGLHVAIITLLEAKKSFSEARISKKKQVKSSAKSAQKEFLQKRFEEGEVGGGILDEKKVTVTAGHVVVDEESNLTNDADLATGPKVNTKRARRGSSEAGLAAYGAERTKQAEFALKTRKLELESQERMQKVDVEARQMETQRLFALMTERDERLFALLVQKKNE
jgi:hypothetical protein